MLSISHSVFEVPTFRFALRQMSRATGWSADDQKLEEQEWASEAATNDVIEAVFAKLDPLLHPVFVLIQETGARRGEVLSSGHWQVNSGKREILFAKRTKSSKNHLVPISD
jgi:hypothetical protein